MENELEISNGEDLWLVRRGNPGSDLRVRGLVDGQLSAISQLSS